MSAQRSRTRRILRPAVRLALIAFLALLAFVFWYVLVAASRPPVVNQEGVRPHAAPRLTAVEIRDLPMQCRLVASGGELNDLGRLPHRNHVYLAKHDGLYFAMFSYWYGSEDQPGGVVRYATSRDGKTWSEPDKLSDPAPEHGIIARGFVKRGGKLYAWYATHTGDTFFRNGKEFSNSAEYESDRNIAILESEWLGPDEGWQFSRVVLEGYLNNYAPRSFGGKSFMALRDQDRQTYLATSEDDGLTWQIGDAMPVPAVPTQGDAGLYLADEPVVIGNDQSTTNVLLRNNNTADGRLWATSVIDERWQEPFPLDFPSDASKFVPLDLADGSAALVGNFEPDVHRALLHLAVSEDSGTTYGKLYRLALEGQYSEFVWRSPQYPHALVDGGELLLAFAYGKRDIAVCSAPADAGKLDQQAGISLVPRLFKGLCNRNMPRYLRLAAGHAGCREHFVWG
uniref:exo-alpha-sialidase n=1 Tax=Parerythrobacter lutipelagi TaxID=1964208 RepID=UPI0010F858BB|nr:exo-alpha-sialidase [Parerythrobacter lutipelagi]